MLERAEDGALEERFVDFVFQPIRGENGGVTNIFIQGSDVTERVRAENHQRLLINELNHRVKNTLASIQSIVSQTLRGVQTKEEASTAISNRILALSRAHNVLTDENWDGADLRKMVENSLEAFQHEGRSAITVSGPPLRLGPHAALSIALALHELATNAVKYGALSSPTGTVDVKWAVNRDEVFELTWTEKGGPTVVKGERRGFGSRLILKVLPLELRGTADIDYDPQGVVFKLTSSVEAVSDRSSSSEV